MIISKAVGIDLGTSNSAVAVMDPADAEVIVHQDRFGQATTPSCVWRDPDSNEIVVGHRAHQRRGSILPPALSVKRKMGSAVEVNLSGRPMTASEVSTEIIAELREQIAEDMKQFGGEGVRYVVDRAIITVPAYFQLPAIEATREAGSAAGLDVLELLNEPTAGAIYYCWLNDISDGNFLVYDLGGGTFDVTVLNRMAGEFSVVAIAGDNFLGGDNFDRYLARLIGERLEADGYAIDADPGGAPEQCMRFAQLVALAEQTKKALTDAEQYLLRDQSIADAEGRRVIVETPFERREFEDLIRPDIERTVELCHSALDQSREQAGITLEDIDHIVLVGGSTRIPLVQRAVREALCSRAPGDGRAQCAEPSVEAPDLCVAMGAAIRAASLGQAIYNDDRTAGVVFRGQSGTASARRAIRGHVELLGADVTLDGGTIIMRNPSTGLELEAPLDADGRFVFTDVPLAEGTTNDFEFTVTDGSGERVVEVKYPVAHDEQQRHLGSEDFGTSVLPIPIWLEGREGERMGRQEVLPVGAKLPAHATFTFYLADRSGHVRLPIYQGNRIIKEIVASVPRDLDVGTPVLFDISCDRQARIVVNARVGGLSFGGTIEAPPPEAPPTDDMIEAAGARFERLRDNLDREQTRHFEAEFGRVRRELDAAIDGCDEAMAVQRMADIDGLLIEMTLARPLRPRLEEALATVELCEQLWSEAGDEIEAIDDERFGTFVADTRAGLRKAYRERDEHEYEELLKAARVMAMYLSAATDEEPEALPDGERALRAMTALTRQASEMRVLAAQSSADETYADVTSCLHALDDVRREWDAETIDAVEVLRRSQSIHQEMQRIAGRLQSDVEGISQRTGVVQFQSRSGLGLSM